MCPKAALMDVHPQFLNAKSDETAANTFTQKEIPTPVVRDIGNGQAMVMEILKVFIGAENPDIVNVAVTGTTYQLTTKTQTSMQDLSDTNTIIRDTRRIAVFDTAATDATVGLYEGYDCKEYDFTDGNGNGILVASSKLYLAVQGYNNTNSMSAFCKILYRMRKVSAVEMLGVIGLE